MTASARTTDHLSQQAKGRAAQRQAQLRQQAEATAKLTSLPVQHHHAAGIDVGDRSHWVCVEATPTVLIPSANFPPTRPDYDNC